jgi:HNH endonuclease
MSLSPAQLSVHQSALSAARTFKRAEAALLDSLLEVERTGVHFRLGYSSLFTYAVSALGLSEAVAYNSIAVARKMREVPELRAQVEEIGVSKAKKIVSVLTKENQMEWLARAKTLSSRALEKQVAKMNPQAATPELTKYVSAERLDLRLGIDEELLGQLRRAQDQVSQSMGKPASLEDTLRAALAFYLRHKDPVEKAERAKKVVNKQVTGTVRAEDKSSARGEATEVTGVTHPVVREKRTPIPARVAHAVRLRDQNRCQAKTQATRCGSTRFIDLHHIQPVSQGGPNTPMNLITLCRAHHRLAHGKG